MLLKIDFESELSQEGYCFGSAIDNSGELLQKNGLLDKLNQCESLDEISELVSNLSGKFGFIVFKLGSIFLYSGKIRYFPVFYYLSENQLVISNEVDSILNFTDDFSINKLAVEAFRCSGFVPFDDTFINEIKQVEAGKIIQISGNEITEKQTFFYSTTSVFTAKYSELKTRLVQVFENIFDRLATSIHGRKVLVPLSGGYDSRMIALSLAKRIPNVETFTYGRKKNNEELKNSRNSAEKLGLSWNFYEYNEKTTANYFETETFREYVDFIGNGTSMPFLQAYIAAKALSEAYENPKDYAVISGDSGDFLGGSQFIKVFGKDLKTSEITELFLQKKFFMNVLDANTKTKLFDQFDIGTSFLNDEYPYSIFEDWDAKEKLTKFIANSARVFDFFGFESLYPYWDNEIVDFFRQVPAEYKEMKKLYDEVLIEKYFIPNGIYFKSDEIQAVKSDYVKQNIKKIVKPFVPKSLLKRRHRKSDWVYYEELTKPMKAELGSKDLKFFESGTEYNEIIIQWYINYFLEKYFSKSAAE